MLSRRHVLKGMAATSAMAATPMWAQVLTQSDTAITTALPTCDITIYQQQNAGKEIVSLMNLTEQPARLDAITPVGLENVNGSLAVRLNQVPEGTLTLAPGERLSFEVEAVSSAAPDSGTVVPNVVAGHVRVHSNHPAFNGVIPVTVFDNQIA